MRYLIILLFFFQACVDNSNHLIQISGEAQGTTYHIKLYGNNEEHYYKEAIKSILRHVDASLSTYLDTSIVSRFNSASAKRLDDTLFVNMVKLSKQIHDDTHGAFDPTVAPLVNAYGFGPSKKLNALNSEELDSLLLLVGMRHIRINENYVQKENDLVQLDFNAIAQGYTVDLIANFLNSEKISSYLVEVGGELIAKGEKANGESWKIGIDKPLEDGHEREVQIKMNVKNTAVATSGNYRKFYVKNGRKYTHTIDPASGLPVNHSLLSATVITNDCARADALATAFMVMGKEKAINLTEQDTSLNAILIYADSTGQYHTYISQEIMKEIID